MFSGCYKVKKLDVSGFKTDKVTSMYGMFEYCKSLESLDLSSFETGNVTDMSSMFSYCLKLKTLDVSHFDTSNVENMNEMFHMCESLTALDVSSFNTENVTDMGQMFQDCCSLTALDLSSFNTANVKQMNWMFYGCYSLQSLNVSSFRMDSIKEMHYFVSNCSSLTALDLSSFDFSGVEDRDECTSDMFLRSCMLQRLTLGDNFGNITWNHNLYSEPGWANALDPGTIISGSIDSAEFEHTAAATYIRTDIGPSTMFRIAVNGVTEPVAGQKPSDAANVLGITAELCTDSDIEASAGDGVYWTADDDGGTVMTGDMTFEAGKKYTVWVRLKPKDGYQFYRSAGLVDSHINGETARSEKSGADDGTILVKRQFTLPEDKPDYLPGDVNENGEIGADDAQMTLKAYVNMLADKESGLTESQMLAADVDGSGTVDATDAQMILKYYVNTLAGKEVTWDDLLPKK